MLPQHLHHRVAGDAVVTIQACHLATNQKRPLQMTTQLSQKKSFWFLSCLSLVVIFALLSSVNVVLKELKTLQKLDEF